MAAISNQGTEDTSGFWQGVVSLRPLKKHFEWWLKGMAICAIPMVVVCTIVIAIELTTPSMFTAGIGKIISYGAEDLLNVAVEASMFGCIILAKDARSAGNTEQYTKMRNIGWGFALLTIITVSFKLFGASAFANEGLLIVRDAAVICYVYIAHMDDDGDETPTLSPVQVANLETRLAEQVAQIQEAMTTASSQLVASVRQGVTSQVANEVANFQTSIGQQVAQSLATYSEQIANVSATPVAHDAYLGEQVAALVGLLNDQARTIQNLTASLSEVKREVRMTVTEIRSFTHEAPALPQLAGATVDAAIEPGDRVKAFLQQWSSPKKPTIQTVMDACQVAKKTATRYRDDFYGVATSSQNEEDE